MSGLKRIAVLVSGGGTNLQALIDAEKSGIINSGRISLVLSSSPDAYALTRAADAGIETLVIDKADHPDREEYSLAIRDALTEANIDLVVLAGFMYILTESFVSAFENRIINVHPALIPSFCGDGFYGLHVHEAVLGYGVKVTGATVHFVSAVTDGGPVILQKAVAVKEDDTPKTLQRRVMEEAEWQILPQAAELFCAGRLSVDGRKVHISEPKESDNNYSIQ